MRVTAVIVDRANYGRMKPLLRVMQDDNDIALNIISCGTTVLGRFKNVVDDIEKDGLCVWRKIYHEVEGSNNESVVASMSLLMSQLIEPLQKEWSDYVMIIGDRYETLAVATVANMLGNCIIHLQGGEQSGNRDEMIRHAITKLSQYHVPATNEACKQLCRFGEDANRILGIGCPSADLADNAKKLFGYDEIILVIYHPEDEVDNDKVVRNLLNDLKEVNQRVLMLWPNIDPGSQNIHKTIRQFIHKEKPNWLRMETHIEPEMFLDILNSVHCCIGNSSAFVREASFFGTPVYLIGCRQWKRELAANVYEVGPYTTGISSLLHKVDLLKRKPSSLYGCPGISIDIVKALKQVKPYYQKVLA